MIAVETAGGNVRISWKTRREILQRLRRVTGTLPTVLAFENVGVSRAVRLDEHGRRQVLTELRSWDEDTKWGPLPDDARALLDALSGSSK